jgi:signal transduction histidine kinase
VITADRREGTVKGDLDARADYAPLWRSLDRNIPLLAKLVIPLVTVTLAGTMLYAAVIAEQVRSSTDLGYVKDSEAAARNAAAAFARDAANPTALAIHLGDIIQNDPEIVGVWIVNGAQPGVPVVASSRGGDVGNVNLLEPDEVAGAAAGRIVEARETANGKPVLEVVLPAADGYIVVVKTSLDAEAELVGQTVTWIVVAGIVAGLLQVATLTAILQLGVVRRARRMNDVVRAFAGKRTRPRLSEGLEPEGHDVLFNLAREVDIRLVELGERERAGGILGELGMLALQGTPPNELAAKALELTRQAAGLARCVLVETSADGNTLGGIVEGRSLPSVLPLWLHSLVTVSAHSRRPVLSGDLGQDSRFWSSQPDEASIVAAIVPLPGSPDPIAVMVGVAVEGGDIRPASIVLMEAVAATLGESLQRGQAEKARNESEAKSRALSTVSHEIRNPLNAMLGFSSLMLTGAAGPLNEKQQAYVQRIEEAGQHLLRLVTNYLDLARLMAGSMQLQIEPVPVATEVQGVIELMDVTASGKGVSLRWTGATDAVARVDRLRFRQVVLNLVSNAIKFTPAHGQVRVEIGGGSNGVRISVIDTGIGIPADRQHLIFREFGQVRAGDTVQGSGLGLVLTKRLVEAMGGFIRFTSAEGSGTIFDVWLPGERTPALAAQKATVEVAERMAS